MDKNYGTVSTYVSDRGWGYLSRSAENNNVEKFFFHVSQYRGKQKPAIGVVVAFSVSPVREGKWPTALDVMPVEQ
jgi:cold shock CspA family protein